MAGCLGMCKTLLVQSLHSCSWVGYRHQFPIIFPCLDGGGLGRSADVANVGTCFRMFEMKRLSIEGGYLEVSVMTRNQVGITDYKDGHSCAEPFGP
jgi:hypothetical protein